MSPNQFPEESTPPHSGVLLPSRLLKVRGAQWFDYVILENDTLVVGQRTPGEGHANLASGEPVQAAGQAQVSGGRIIELDNASGHYLPTGPEASRVARETFRRAGFFVPADAYVEKFWNIATNS